MILSCCLKSTEHDKWLVKSCWKILQFLRHGHCLSIKSHHSETISNVLFWNWKQCAAITKSISSTVSISHRNILLEIPRKVWNHKATHKKPLRHVFYTQKSWVIVSVVVQSRYNLRFTQNFLKIFKRQHFYFSKFSWASSKSDKFCQGLII